ncbi:MAG TPA: hypothetical protein VHV31_07410, partial [Nitrolancea sp.]|nr:hypothetical protein [Nitrolancea sp.]
MKIDTSSQLKRSSDIRYYVLETLAYQASFHRGYHLNANSPPNSLHDDEESRSVRSTKAGQMGSGFDEVAKAIATNMPRRKVLKLIAGSVVASVSSGLLGSAASANSKTSTSDTLPPGTDYCDDTYCYSNGSPTFFVNGLPVSYDVNGTTSPVCVNSGDPCVNVNSPCFNYNGVCVNNTQPPNPCVNVIKPCINAADPCFNYNGICVNNPYPANPCLNVVNPCVNVSD